MGLVGGTEADPDEWIGSAQQEWDGFSVAVVPWAVRAALVRAGWNFIRIAHASTTHEPIPVSTWLAGMASVALEIGKRTGAGSVLPTRYPHGQSRAGDTVGWVVVRQRGDEEESIHINYSYTEGLTGTQRNGETTRKLMGGTLVMAWGW